MENGQDGTYPVHIRRARRDLHAWQGDLAPEETIMRWTYSHLRIVHCDSLGAMDSSSRFLSRDFSLGAVHCDSLGAVHCDSLGAVHCDSLGAVMPRMWGRDATL